jgi:epoxyqueuosine reductase
LAKIGAATPSDIAKVTEELLLHLAERGCKGRIVSVQHLRDLQEEIEGRYRQGLFDKEFYQERLAWFDFRTPDSLRGAKSLVVIAVPRPQSQAVFTRNRKSRALIIPPTYVANEKTRRQMEHLVARILATKGYRVARTALPLKALAARSGLCSYGRNNICYVPGMGSFLQLVAFCSDLPCQKDSWQEAQTMKSCQNCHACQQNCPTGAIASDRFLLHAERCISFHNERRGDIPFPAWMDPSWHNCMVGCLHCQTACPQNRKFLKWIEEKEEFSQEETALLLEGTPRDRLPVATVRKLKRLDFLEDVDTLPRNLSVFFRKRK